MPVDGIDEKTSQILRAPSIGTFANQASACRVPLWLLGGLALLAFVARLAFAYETDELAHLHIAWNLTEGLVPYRDFYDGHPPLFHALLAPLLAGQTGSPLPLLVPLRMLALGISVAMLALHWRFAAMQFGRSVALGSALVLVLLDPWGTRGLELRPDWLALCFVLCSAIFAMRSQLGLRRGRALARFAASGLLAGIAVCTTQKALFPAAAILVWQAGSACAASGGARKERVLDLAAWTTGLLVPLAMGALALARLGALETMLQTALIAPMGFRAIHHWGFPLQEGTIAHLGVYAAGLAGLVRTISGFRSELASASARSLVAVLALFGILSLLRTSDPSRQWLLFAVLPWLAILAALEAQRVAQFGAISATDKRLWIVALALPLLGLKWFNAFAAVLVWTPLLYMAHRALHRHSEPDRRLRALGAIGLATAVVMFVGRTAEAFAGREGSRQGILLQNMAMHFRDGQGLQLWPVLAPFAHSPAYHWYACSPMMENLSRTQLDGEYLRLLREGKVRKVLANHVDLRLHFPLTARELDRLGFARYGVPSRHRLSLFLRPERDR